MTDPLPFDYRIVRRKRVKRRLHLSVDDDGSLLAIAPDHLSATSVHRLLVDNADRVAGYLDRARGQLPQPLTWSAGSLHDFRGRAYPLALHPRRERRRHVEFNPGGIDLFSDCHAPDTVRAVLRTGYLEQANRIFRERLDRIAARTQWACDEELTLRLQRMKRTWGTCSNRGVIRLNTHLVKAPPECLDYVIAHEVCHLQVMNHGPDFYKLQNALYPEWKSARAHLRAYGRRYTRD